MRRKQKFTTRTVTESLLVRFFFQITAFNASSANPDDTENTHIQMQVHTNSSVNEAHWWSFESP